MGVRPNRWMIRISLMLVIAMGLFGYWFAVQAVQIDPAALEMEQPDEGIVWLDLIATLGEEAIQLFLGFTSD